MTSNRGCIFHGGPPATSAADEITRLSARVEELEAEVKEWACDQCSTVYPGPPQRGVMCVICPKCGGDTMPWPALKLRRMGQERDELRVALTRCVEALRDGLPADAGQHRASRYTVDCDECDDEWPCQTARLTAALAVAEPLVTEDK